MSVSRRIVEWFGFSTKEREPLAHPNLNEHKEALAKVEEVLIKQDETSQQVRRLTQEQRNQAASALKTIRTLIHRIER